MRLPSFKSAGLLTLGIELELMLLDPQTKELSAGALNLLDLMRVRGDKRFFFCPEITQTMIEYNSGVHGRWHELLVEARAMRAFLLPLAHECGLRISGGGTHAFRDWRDQDFFPKERYLDLGLKYGYLSKQFTVFGMHVHVGVGGDGSAAIGLIRSVSPWVPLLIAISAASPFREGSDTGFACSRLHSLTPFPYAGAMPDFADWDECADYVDGLIELGVVGSIKDFYWDIRPKPEFGTIEFRVFDTPLTAEIACVLAGLVQLLCAYYLDHPTPPPRFDTYPYNRFQACRYGLAGEMVDPWTGQRQGFLPLAYALFDTLEPMADALDAKTMLALCRKQLEPGVGQADLQRLSARQCVDDFGRLMAWQADCFASGQVRPLEGGR
ncbi:YbdK family carboxylate-amine ligase [Jeongeupia wiesaeckerbachi]|uniref:YbdK family carboxylate-amine ligase n=1 Tax=Jeongeupia wiesaeckerbachi TaxID=3051218 RepID=UPI003D80063D